MSPQPADDGFHEIQLNGKQLVFLFMAATVVSVVIFLCGVLVGRGVRAERGTVADSSLSTNGDATPQQPPPATPPPVGSDPTAAAPPPAAADDLSYFNRLEKTNQPAEELKPSSEPAPVAPERKAPAPKPAATSAPAPSVAPASASTAAADPAAQGFALQIAALRERGEADAIAKRLSSKGYSAYVLAPAQGTPSVYRVRVGKFKTRREAEVVAAKLQKDEQYNPWITR